MLNMIRRHADSWMIKAILWLIVFAFVATIFYSWGMGGRVSGRSGVVATVDGVSIQLSEYDRSYNNLVNFYRDQFKDQFSQELVEKLDLKNTALDALIQKYLLLREADRRKIEISDQELAERIKAIPAFQRDNAFNKNLYENFLSYSHQTPQEFEDNQREAMLMEKVENLIKDGTQVNDTEILEAFKRENEKAKIRYVQIARNRFKPAEAPSNDALQKYFDDHKTEFEIPEQIKAEYVKVTPASQAEDLTIPEEDIQDYYSSNLGEYLVKKRYQASHILFRANPKLPEGDADDAAKEKALDEADAAAKSQAEDILKKIKAGEEFSALARIHSADKASGSNGGSLGQFSQGTMVPEFERALDDLKTGEIGGPVKTAFGYHLIRLDKVEDARTRPLEEVKEEIVKKLKERKGQQRARRTIKKIVQEAEADGNLERAARAAGQNTQTTGFISTTSHNVPDIGMVPEFYNTAFVLKDGVLSAPIHTAEASFILKVVERKAPEIPKLDDVLTEVTAKMAIEEAERLTQEKVDKLLVEMKQGKDLKTIAGELKLEEQESPFFSRADTIPGIGNIQEIKDRVFATKAGESTSGSSRHSHYLIQVLEKTKAGDPDSSEKEELASILKKEKSVQVFKDWLDKTKEETEILIDTTLL